MLTSSLRSVVKGLASFAFDESCLVCGEGEVEMCNVCRKSWSQKAAKIKGENFPIFSKVSYDDAAAKLVLFAKESGLSKAKALLANALADAILDLLTDLDLREGQVHLVPIPSSPLARTRRGEDFLYELAKITNKRLITIAPRFDFQVSRVLKLQKLTIDQSGLSERQRRVNLSGAFVADSKCRTSAQLLILDDVITTGSTLREAYRALKERNLTVLGAATACASQRRQLIR